jgi:hypothetical protein
MAAAETASFSAESTSDQGTIDRHQWPRDRPVRAGEELGGALREDAAGAPVRHGEAKVSRATPRGMGRGALMPKDWAHLGHKRNQTR